MFLRRKLRFGGTLMIIGGLVAAAGEIVNILNMDVLSSSWRLSLGLIVIGMLILILGLSTFASTSDQVTGFGFVGSILLTLGGLLLIIGTIALDWIILPFLINVSNTIAAAINQPTAAAQDQLNTIINTLNNLSNTIQKVFPGAVPHVAIVHLPKADGRALINSVLVQLNVPTLDSLQWWGHFSLSGGPLTLGCLIMGLALPHRNDRPTLPSALLILFALLNIVCQLVHTIPPLFGNLTAIGLFLTLAWIGLSAWSARQREIVYADDDEEVVILES
ncbi:MAG: hypothetical protein H0U76_20865 [Ktedonobacteraceae bacterium]|nr:hypothetical protein [Ktedonobacteraceae bacterium]